MLTTRRPERLDFVDPERSCRVTAQGLGNDQAGDMALISGKYAKRRGLVVVGANIERVGTFPILERSGRATASNSPRPG